MPFQWFDMFVTMRLNIILTVNNLDRLWKKDKLPPFSLPYSPLQPPDWRRWRRLPLPVLPQCARPIFREFICFYIWCVVFDVECRKWTHKISVWYPSPPNSPHLLVLLQAGGGGGGGRGHLGFEAINMCAKTSSHWIIFVFRPWPTTKNNSIQQLCLAFMMNFNIRMVSPTILNNT
jgi:hypothetical protein